MVLIRNNLDHGCSFGLESGSEDMGEQKKTVILEETDPLKSRKFALSFIEGLKLVKKNVMRQKNRIKTSESKKVSQNK